MPSNVRQLLDNGVPVYPITDKSLVIGLQDVPFESYVVAWDGASTPVPANIPAGVVVNYNGTNYTGTLVAGSATAPYLYLVASASQPGEYDRYIVTHTGATYAWTPLGSTTPVSPVIADDLVTNDPSKALSAKQGKILGDKTSELEAKVDGLDYTYSEYYEQTGMITLTGNATTSDNFTRYIIKNKGYSKIKAVVYSPSNSYTAVAFYNSLSWGSATLMQAQAGTNGTHTYELNVPSGCACIIVVNRTASRPLPDIQLFNSNGDKTALNENLGFYRGVDSGVNFKLSNLVFSNGKGIGISTGVVTTNAKTIAYEPLLNVSDFAVNGRLYFSYLGTSTNRIWKCVAFFTESETFISPRFGYKDVDSVGVPFNAKYFRLSLGLADSGGNDIGGDAADYDLDNAYIRKSLEVVLKQKDEPGTLVYSGAKIQLKNYFGLRLVMSLSSSYAAPQGATAYGDKLFVFHDGNANAQVYDLATMSLVQSVTLTDASADYHCNTVAFGTEKYDAGDTYPLLYVAMEKATVHKALVYRVQNTGGTWTITKVQEIIFPAPADDTIWYPNVTIDRNKNKFYIWGLGNSPWQSGKTNTLKYARFAMPAYSNENVTIYWSNREDVFTFTNEPTGQGNAFVNGKIYQALGLDTSAEIVVVNPSTKTIESRIDLVANGFSKEPEFVFEYNGDLYVGFYSKEIYKLIL